MSPYAPLPQGDGLTPPPLITRKPVSISPAPSSPYPHDPVPPTFSVNRNSGHAPLRSESVRSGLETITIPKTKYKQLVEALAISVQLLQEGIATTKSHDGDRKSDNQENIIEVEPVLENYNAYLGIQKLDVERLYHDDEILEGVFKQGYGPLFFDEYQKSHDLEPFQERLLSTPSSTSLRKRFKLRRELWEMLFGQVARNERPANMYPKSVSQIHLEKVRFNKIALFVEVLSTSMGLLQYNDDSEEDFDRRLGMLVSICRTNGLYIERDCRLKDRSSQTTTCNIQMLSFKTDCEIWSDMRVGAILSALYAEGLLIEPALGDLRSHRLNAAQILASLYPFRFFISEFEWTEHFHSRTICPNAQHPIDILNMRVRDLIQLCRKENESNMVKASGLQFSMKLVNIKQLQVIGNINIEWTDNLYEHLELSFTGFPVLKLYWFAWATLEIPLARLGTVANSSRDELLSTYHLIFGLPPTTSFTYLPSGRRPGLKRYNELETHPRLQHRFPFNKGREMKGEDLTGRGRPYDYGIDYHLPIEETHVASFAATNIHTDLYERYPVFEDKLRILVAYMDSQKPGGLRGLWYDKRDSGAWFTFWAVLWIGGISLLIALLSLGVSVLQAVVAMKQLYHPNPFWNGTYLVGG